MNIWALEGHKVEPNVDEYGNFINGYSFDQEKMNTHCDPKRVYTISRTEVSGSSTDVYLVEVPGIRFNSVCFVDAVKQPEEENKKHRDWSEWNRG